MKFLIIFLYLFTLTSITVADETTFNSQAHEFRTTIVASGLENPWGMAFLPDGRILVTERPGRLRVITNGRLLSEAVSGLPDIREHGQGGLLDVALHPDFAKNKLVYLSYAGKAEGGYSTEVIRGQLNDMQLEYIETLFIATPKSGGGRHFGSRLLFDGQGHLFITLGDRGERDNAQMPQNHAGSLIRIMEDGSIPTDNPFLNRDGAQPEIYTLGNRNMQGIALEPGTGRIWTHEHGPQGGDEINIMRAGKNYGWPVITYGVNYIIGTKIGEGEAKPGMEQPVHYWVPSIAPSGMTFYTGERFPKWQNNLFVGSLKFGQLVRLVVEEDQVVNEERMLDNALGRIRDVRQGPEGALYLLTDESDGQLYKLLPVN